MIKSTDGFAPAYWLTRPGNVLLARRDRQPLSPLDAEVRYPSTTTDEPETMRRAQILWDLCSQIIDIFGDDGTCPPSILTPAAYNDYDRQYGKYKHTNRFARLRDPGALRVLLSPRLMVKTARTEDEDLNIESSHEEAWSDEEV